MKSEEVKQESLEKAIEQLEGEARMVLPGIQALFGFQLIAVFNQRFGDLSPSIQMAHFIAMIASAMAVLLILTPAAYHRQAEPRQISERLSRIGSFCMTYSMLPLCIGMAVEFFVIGNVLGFDDGVSYALGAVTFASLFSAWFIFPQIMRRRDR